MSDDRSDPGPRLVFSQDDEVGSVTEVRREFGEGDGGGINGDIGTRLSNLEAAVAGLRGEISGLKHGQTMTLAAVGLVLAAVLGFGIYTLQKVDTLPAEMRGIADSITGAITATRQVDDRQPIIINVPPTPAVTPKESEQPTKAPADSNG